MMKYLRSSPSIIIPDQYPYELKLLTYYAKAFEVLTIPVNKWLPATAQQIYADADSLKPNPFNHYEFERTFPNRMTIYDYFEKKVPTKDGAFYLEKSYRIFTIILGDQIGRSDGTYFAEKTDILQSTRDFSRIAFSGTKEIILTRDPRDLFCSYRSFWKSRPEESVKVLKSISERMLSVARSGEARGVIFIRYEDLVSQNQDILNRISKFLEIDDGIRADPEFGPGPVQEARHKRRSNSLNRQVEE